MATGDSLHAAWEQGGQGSLETKAVPGTRKASLQACACPSCAGETAAHSQMPTRRSCTWLWEEKQSVNPPENMAPVPPTHFIFFDSRHCHFQPTRNQ